MGMLAPEDKHHDLPSDPINPFAETKGTSLFDNYRVDPFHTAGGLLHIRASIIWETLPEIAFFSFIALIVCIINQFGNNVLQLPPTLIATLGTMLGFIVSYRTSSAYERYSEGRKLWSQVILAQRAWSRVIWHHLSDEPHATDEMIVKYIIEKKSMINIGTAFAVALKHYLRGEPGVGYKDLYPLVAFLPRYHLPSSSHADRPDLPNAAPDHHKVRNHDHAHEEKGTHLRRLHPAHPLLPSSNPPPSQLKDYIPFWNLFADLFYLFSNKERGAPTGADSKEKRRIAKGGGGKGVEGNLPLEITLIMSAYVGALNKRHGSDHAAHGLLMNAVSSMCESLVGLERILYTPLPVSYGLHLQHTIWIYLLLLPTQLHNEFGWSTIPAVFLIGFVYLGFLQIGRVIENPFGYDHNDLDLDSFCHIIQNEANEVTAHNPMELDPAFCFVDENLPFSYWPEWKGRSAKEMVHEKVSLDVVRETLKHAGGKVRSRAATRKAARHVVLDLDTAPKG